MLTSYAYDYLGRRVSAADPLANTTSWTYNALGQVTSEANAQGKSATFIYDALGNCVGSTDFNGTLTTYAYDSLGRLLSQEMPMDPSKTMKTSYAYDGNGNILSEAVAVTASIDRFTTYTYNSRGFLTGAEQNGEATSYSYDGRGLLLKMADNAGHETAYQYDHLGRATGVTDALGQTEHYEYNAQGLLWKKTDRNGTVTSYAYDSLGRVLSETAGAQTTTTAYYANGLVKSVANETLTLGYAYNSLGQMASETESSGGSALSAKEYEYDARGLRTKLKAILPGSTHITTYTYDSLGRLSTVSEGGRTAAYSYDFNGNRTSLVTPGATASYAYNLANLVTGMANAVNGSTQSSYSYTYLRDGNQASKSDHAGRTVAYAYDGSGRLVSESDGSQSTTYTYDSAGNRSAKADANGTEHYAYDANNRLLSARNETAIAIEETVFSYDANGNQLSALHGAYSGSGGDPTVSVDAGGGYELFRYDARNQLVAFADGVVEAVYDYRPDGLRHSKAVGGVKTAHVLDGANVIADVTGGVEAYYTRGINILWDSSGAYYLFNAHGDVVAIAGAVTETAEYDAFGNVISGGFSSPFMYCGEYLDSESGMYYLRARYYNPATGRFLSEDMHWNVGAMVYGDDPLQLNAYTYVPVIQAIMQSGNLYVYCMNNPLRYTDPYGLDAGDPFKSIDAAAKDFGMCYNEQSMKDNLEYYSYAYSYTVKEKRSFLWWSWTVEVTYYSYTKPVSLGAAGGSISLPVYVNDNNVVVSLFHTHAAYDKDYLNDKFSLADINTAMTYTDAVRNETSNDKAVVYIYVVTPNGFLLKYDPVKIKISTISKKMPFDPNHPDHKK